LKGGFRGGDSDWTLGNGAEGAYAALNGQAFPDPADGWLVRQVPSGSPTSWVTSAIKTDPSKKLVLPVQTGGSYVVQAAWSVGGVAQTWSASKTITI